MLNYSWLVGQCQSSVCNVGELPVFKEQTTPTSDTSTYIDTHTHTASVYCISTNTADVTVMSVTLLERLLENDMYGLHMFPAGGGKTTK